MTWMRSNARPLIGLVIVIVAVLGAIFITAATPTRTPHVVKLIPVAYRAPSTGGGISVPHYFVRALRHHAWCGAPTTRAKRGIHGIFRQYFRHCQMAIGPVKVYGLPAPTPLPESSIIGGLLGGTPTARPQPTHTPLRSTPVPPPSIPTSPHSTVPAVQPNRVPTNPSPPTAAPVTAAPQPNPASTAVPAPASASHTASCQQGSSLDCALMLVDLINTERLQHGIAPLSYSTLLTNGNFSTCIGALGHALHMANDLHTIAHDQFPADVCAGTAMGENVGVSAYGSLYADAMQIHTGMMTGPSEVYTPGCSGNHHCDWMDPNHTYVGIAFVAGTFQGLPAHYLSEEFSDAG